MRYSFVSFFVFVFCINSYAQALESTEISFLHDSLKVKGTLVKPANAKARLPVILIVPGSGQNDRDGTMVMKGENIECLYPGLVGDTLKSYKELSEALALRGYAVLRYEKLEYTYKPKDLGNITFDKLWLPIMSAIDYIKTRPDIDTNKIILLGHSEGCSILPYVASKRHDIKALISIAGPHTTFDSLLVYQMRFISDACCQDTNQANFQAKFILNYFNDVRKQEWRKTKSSSLFGITPNVWFDYLAVTDSTEHFYNMANKPTLFIGLERDINVPVEMELDGFKKGIKISADFIEIPNLVHYMVTLDNPNISPDLVNIIIDWLHKNVPLDN